jgi:hypothetical protein
MLKKKQRKSALFFNIFSVFSVGWANMFIMNNKGVGRFWPQIDQPDQLFPSFII